MSIFERIRDEGNKQGLSIASIEKKTGLSNGAVRKWDNSVPSVDNLYKVASLLKCSMEYLLTGENNLTKLSDEEIDWINLYRQLAHSGNDKIINECVGFVKGYIKRDEFEHNVAISKKGKNIPIQKEEGKIII